MQSGDLNSASEQHQLQNCLFNPTWDQTHLFNSSLSSIVSSPAVSNSGDGVVLRELIGRLGSICDSGHISPESFIGSANTSCYATPLNSPPKLNLSMAGTQFPDPGFAERAAKYSCFAAMGIDSGNFSGVSANRPLKVSRSQSELGDSREGSSVSDQITAGIKPQNRKRKPKSISKDLKVASENEESKAKKPKEEANESNKKGEKSQKHNKDNDSEPPKDYIHVRARRGQATDSHSLAERVRREKISERMKFLQDLVPGCDKVTGKAVMLDEIINYVQSLQRQVEFLSMKLSTVNPRMDFNMEALLSKEMLESLGSLQQGVYSMDSSAPTLPYSYGSGMSLPSMDGFGGVAPPPPQVSGFWEDDLQSLVQMGFGPNQAQDFQGSLGAGQMKVEL